MSRISIRVQMTVLVGLICVLLVAAAAAGAAMIATERENAAVRNRVARLALNMAEALDRGMFERYREVKLLAELGPLRDLWLSRPAEIREVFNALQESQPDYAWIGFAAVDGTVVASTQGMLEGQLVAQRPWFIEGLRAPFAGDVHDAKLLAGLLRPNPSGEPFRFVDVAAPVRDRAGKLIGVLGGHLSWTWADDLRAALITPQLRAQGTELWILSAEGVTLLGPRWGAQALPAEQIEAIRREASGTFLDQTGSGVFSGFAVAKGYRSYPGLGWIVLARQPAAVAFAGSRLIVQTIAALGALIAVVGLLLTAAVSGQLSRPIRTLTREADRIGRDATATMLPRVAGSREVVTLSASLRSLLRRAGEAEQKAVTVQERALMEGQRLDEDMRNLRRLAESDSLTGLLNRRALQLTARDAFEQFTRHGRSFAVMVVDIDFFKRVNDQHGHPAGDEVIKHVAAMLSGAVRTTDRVARFGGEEFVVLLREVGEAGAQVLAERMRNAVKDSFVSQDGHLIKVTISLGLTAVAQCDRDFEDVIARADQALYEAKQSGRNRTVVRSGTAPVPQDKAA